MHLAITIFWLFLATDQGIFLAALSNWKTLTILGAFNDWSWSIWKSLLFLAAGQQKIQKVLFLSGQKGQAFKLSWSNLIKLQFSIWKSLQFWKILQHYFQANFGQLGLARQGRVYRFFWCKQPPSTQGGEDLLWCILMHQPKYQMTCYARRGLDDKNFWTPS